jgi:hypothetical protein
MNRDGWRVLVKGLSVLAGVAAFAVSLFWLLGAAMLAAFHANPGVTLALAALFALVGIALCVWPCLYWKPAGPNRKT